MTKIEEKISNLPVSSLYFARNYLGIINIILFIIATIAVINLKMPFYLKNTLSWIIVSMPWLYYWLAKKIDKVLINLLVEKVDLNKYEAYWLKHVNSKFGTKALAYHALGVVAFYCGNFDESLHYFEQSRHEKRQSEKVKRLLEDDREVFIIQSKIFLERSGNSKSSDFQEVIRLLASKPYLKAILDVVYNKQSSHYFETNNEEKKTKIGKLLHQYYKAENSLLLGNKEKSKELFANLVKENPRLFIVQESKKKLSVL